MFGNNLSKIRSGESDLSLDIHMDGIIKELVLLDRKLGDIDENHHMKIIDVVNHQAHELEALQRYFILRLVRVVDRYIDMLVKLEERKKEANLKLKQFDKEAKDKIRVMKAEGFVDNVQLKQIKNEMHEAKTNHDKYLKSIADVENHIKFIKDKIRRITKSNAYESRTIYKHSWI